MNAREFLTSRFAIEFAMFLGKTLPVGVGYAVANLLGAVFSRRKGTAPVQAMRANQFVVHDRKLLSQELDRVVKQAFQAAARSIFDLYHWMDRPKTIFDKVIIEDSFMRVIQMTQRAERGVILALPHIGNFDLVGRASVLKGLKFQAITTPMQAGGYQLQNKMRRKWGEGVEITPASMEAIRQAIQRLKAGGCVVCGVDRPMPETQQTPRFFGLPAPVPVAHVRLALRLDLPVNVLGVAQDREGIYHLWASDGIEMERGGGPDEEVLANAERVLGLVERNIRDYPVQWNMTFPVWPQMLAETP